MHILNKYKQANVASLNHGLERKLADSNPWFAIMGEGIQRGDLKIALILFHKYQNVYFS